MHVTQGKLHTTKSSISWGPHYRESHDDEDCRSQYYEAYECGEQINNGICKTNNEALTKPTTTRRSTMRDPMGVRPSSARTASVPIQQYGSTRSHRRSSNSTTQTYSRPTTSGQASSRAVSTAPTSAHSSRPNSRRYSSLTPLNTPSGSLPQDTRRLLHRSATTTPQVSVYDYPSLFPAHYIATEADDTPTTIIGISYPGRPGESTLSQSSPNLPLTPQSPDHDHQHSATHVLGNDLTPPQLQQTYTNYTPPANIDWTSSETRRRHYYKIDKATTGLRGVWTRFAPRKLGGGSKYGRFYGGHEDDVGSVRRFRLELGDEGSGVVELEGLSKKRRFFSLSSRKGQGRS